jgi:glycosyltransferase involved in cell wall biosynthesis
LISDKSIFVSLIIAVYKRIDFLDLVLKSVERQTYRDMEVIIAEDDQDPEVAEFVKRTSSTFSFPLKHVFHEDRGFRKNKILNAAVRVAEGNYLVFIDGDCLLHEKFVEEHVRNRGENLCLFGRRVMLGADISQRILKARSLSGLSFFRLMFTSSRHIEDALYLPWFSSRRNDGVKGCNFSLALDLLKKINGFDEDFEKPYGGEDTDVERRLRLIHASFRCTKFKTVQYHLFHGGRENRSHEWENEGKAFYQKKVDSGVWFCENGLTGKGRSAGEDRPE